MAVLGSKSYSGIPGVPIYGGRNAPAPSPANTLTVSLPSGSVSNYPLQFGRAFAKGYITGDPQVLISDVPVATQQADVKNRYDDGSVKFAIISIVLPTLDTTPVILTISNRSAVVNSPETIANMLANYDFEATISLESGGSPVLGAPASARTFLSTLTDGGLAAETTANGPDSRYWTQGPVCTTVILCDHTAKTLDMGLTVEKTVRPIFYLEFWPTLSRYRVRHAVESSDFEKFGDTANIDLIFTTGQSSPVAHIDQAGVSLYAGTFNTRRFWAGTTFPTANLNHNIAYLSFVKVLPNFDPDLVVNPSVIADYSSEWALKDKTIGANPYWIPSMPDTGGRPDFGFIPKWDMFTVYDGSAHMHEISEHTSNTFGNYNMFWREGDAGRDILPAVSGIGKPLSKEGRPQVFNVGSNFPGVHTDAPTVVGTLGSNGMVKDDYHTPGAFWWSYLSTGEAIWQEKLMQLASWGFFVCNPAPVFNSVGNGRNSTDLILNRSKRGYGRQIRNRGRAWWASLEGTVEQNLFAKSMNDAIAYQAGLVDIPGLLVGDPVRDAWNTNYASVVGANGRPNALQWLLSHDSFTFSGTTNTTDAYGLWQQTYAAQMLYHCAELGWADAKTVADWSTKLHIDVANSTEPFHLTSYWLPSRDETGALYQTLDDMHADWSSDGSVGSNPGEQMPTSPTPTGFGGAGAPGSTSVLMEGYALLAFATIAMATEAGVPGQATAYTFLKQWYDNSLYYTDDPRYAVLAREA